MEKFTLHTKFGVKSLIMKSNQPKKYERFTIYLDGRIFNNYKKYWIRESFIPGTDSKEWLQLNINNKSINSHNYYIIDFIFQCIQSNVLQHTIYNKYFIYTIHEDN